ncbi:MULTISPECIES: VanW family protein [Bacillaceae]|uniref:VanW family protein n=1 Tax=Bacillaceae TaxID=186817 RepID=UPI00319E4AE2
MRFYLNGEFVDVIGGGIWQTSSTLFNAVDQLGVSYIERNHHFFKRWLCTNRQRCNRILGRLRL